MQRYSFCLEKEENEREKEREKGKEDKREIREHKRILKPLMNYARWPPNYYLGNATWFV